MSLSTDVEQLLEVLGPFYEYVKEEEEPGVGPEQNGILGKFSGNISLFLLPYSWLKNGIGYSYLFVGTLAKTRTSATIGT